MRDERVALLWLAKEENVVLDVKEFDFCVKIGNGAYFHPSCDNREAGVLMY